MSNLQGKALRPWSLAVAILVPFLCNPSEGGEYGELRMDFDLNYFPYQNITEVFNTDDMVWLYGMNYDYKTEACVYFKKVGLSQNELHYTYNVLLNGKWQSLPHHGTFFKDDGEAYYPKQASRNSSNTMTAVKAKDNPDIRDYRLVYGKDGCAVFRVPRKLSGMGCMVLLADSVVATGMDQNCQSIYGHACGATPKFIKVYQVSCKNSQVHK